MPKITIKELAQQLGLSISTVSRALNNSYEIKEETRKKVQALALELGYTPDVYASNLRSRKSKTIGIVIPEITNSFFSQAINGIEEVAREQGYHVLIYLTHESYEQEVSVARLLMDGRVDGVLMSVSNSDHPHDHIESFRERNIPLILFDRVFEDIKTLKVTTDDFQSGYNAAYHLIDKGCKHIAYTEFSNCLSIDNRRKQGFIMAAQKTGTNYSEINCTQDNASNVEHLKEVLLSDNAPDGIFSPVESLGLLVYEVCAANDICIPQQVKLISFSNLPAAPFLNPPLTTLKQPAFEMGQYACNALFRAIKNSFLYDEQEVAIPSMLIERGSTATD
jgi:LacI family transcriptional regulator